MPYDGIARRGRWCGGRIKEEEGCWTKRWKNKGAARNQRQPSHNTDADAAIDETKERQQGCAGIVFEEPGQLGALHDAAHHIRHFSAEWMFAVNLIALPWH